MNETRERLETDLLAIIKEGQNLTEGYVEIKPGIKIRAGREREFERLCDNYYELEFNQIIENDTDTITPVYESLVKLVETENEEFYISKAAEFVSETKSEVERFKNLIKSFNTVDNAYKLTVKNLNDLYLKRENTTEWQQKVNELNGEVGRLTENSAILTEQILTARKNVNETLIKYAEEQMELIRQNFLNTTKEADKAPTLDHNFVLASDKLEYDSLYRLVLILKHANEIKEFDKLVCLDDMMMVTEDQRDILNSTVLPNIKLYGYIKAPEKKETNIYKDTNNDFISRIKGAMKLLEERGKARGGAKKTQNGIQLLSEYRIEYDKLLEILKVLNKANASDLNLVNVWDSIYVLSEDKDKIINLLNDSKILKNLNPDFKKREENEKLIEELYAYLDEMANKVTSYTGVANLPIKSTNAIGDRAWAVTERDFEEANRIIEIIKLLQSQTDNLVSVWGIANINVNDISKFKKLANATKRFGDKVPSIPENEAEIDKVRDQLRDLIIRAKGADKSLLATNGLVLAADYELYKLLEEKFKYLDAAKASDNLLNVDGVLIDDKYVTKYHSINEKITTLLNAQAVVDSNTVTASPEVANTSNITSDASEDKEIDFSANDKEIANLKGRLKELSAKSSHNETERKIFDLLSNQIEILENAKKSNTVIESGGLLFASEEDKDKYFLSLVNMNELSEVNGNAYTNTNKSLVPHDFYEKYFGLNDMKIADLKNEMAKLESKLDTDELAAKIYNYLGKQVELLEKAKTSDSVVDMLGFKFASEDDKAEYLSIQANLDEISNALEQSNANDSKTAKEGIKDKLTGLKKKVTGVRKLGNGKFSKFVKENWKQIIAVGLATAAVLYFLPQLIPALIFSNSCNAAAIPALSGVFNAISSAIAPFAGISFVPGMGAINLGVSANLAGPALIEALAKLGIVSVAGLTIGKGIKQYMNRDNENRLPDPNKKNIVQKIADLTYESDSVALEPNPSLTQTDLINAQVEYEANQENLTGEGLTEEELNAQIEEGIPEIFDDEQQAIPASESETPKREMTKEEKIALGERIKQASRESTEAARLSQAQKMAEEEGIDVEEALERIQRRAEELTRFSGPKSAIREPKVEVASETRDGDGKTAIEEKYKDLIIGSDYYAEIPDEASIEEARKLQAEEEEAERLEQQSGTPDTKPVVEVPNTDEVIKQLAGGSVTEDQEIELLDVDGRNEEKIDTHSRIKELVDKPIDTSKTSQVIETILRGPQQEVQQTTEDPIIVSDKNNLSQEEIEILLSGRSGTQTLSQEEIERMLAGDTMAKEQSVDDIDSLNLTDLEKRQLKALMEKAKNLQFSLDRSVNPPQVMIDEYQRQIELANQQIEELTNKGRGR